MLGGIYHQLFMFSSLSLYLCLHLHLRRSVPPLCAPHKSVHKHTHTHTHTHTLEATHTVAASTEELHECTHNWLFCLLETSTHTYSKMAPTVFLSLSVSSLLGHTTWTHTLSHMEAGELASLQSHLSLRTVFTAEPNLSSVGETLIRGESGFSVSPLRVRSSPPQTSATPPTQRCLSPPLLSPGNDTPDSPHRLSHCITKT